MKKIVLFISLALIMVVFLSACGGAEKTASTTAAPQITSEDPVKVELAFPDGAPKLNESTAFTCTITNNEAAAKKISIELKVPKAAFTLESGSYSWSGTVPANSQTTVIEAMLKTYHTGHWQIDAAYHIDAEAGAYGGDFTTTIYVNLGMTSSQWGITPPWQK
jgi:hypothetical protein